MLKNRVHILIFSLVLYKLKKTMLQWPLTVPHIHTFQCRHKIPDFLFAICYSHFHLPNALSVCQNTFWNEVGQGKRSTIEIAGYCNLKIFGGEWNLKVCHLASDSRRENFKRNWEKEIFSKGLERRKENLMQERGKVQDESGSSCGETGLWNKHFWKRSERCTRRASGES